MTLVRLLTFDEAADTIGVPKGSLRTAADKHGKTIHMGRTVRLHPDDLEELINLCHVGKKGQDFIGENQPDGMASGKSGTPEIFGSRPARAAANKLKARSPISSARNTAPVVQLHPTN